MGGGTADGSPTGGRKGRRRNGRRRLMASLPIPDELLADIFLRLPTAADLARASAACVSFRDVAEHPSLLQRYRKLHAPPLLGFLDHHNVFYPATASAASAVGLAADFSFYFLPAPTSDWLVQDIRDGRVLLDRSYSSPSTVVFPEVVVCDPLHRRYLQLPPITYDLAAASLEDPILTKKGWIQGEIFLDPTSHGEEADETSFTVIRMAYCETKLVAFVFSSNTGQWRTLASLHWSDRFADFSELTMKLLLYSRPGRHYVYGCFYWLATDGEGSTLLVLDSQKMEFSLAETPPETKSYCNYKMVEAGEGRAGMFLLEDIGSVLTYFIRQNDGGNHWIKVKTMALDSWAQLICSMENHLLLYQGKTSLLEPACFKLDIKTFKLEKVCTLGSNFYLRAYFNFPPSLLSSPTISSGVEKWPEKEMLEEGSTAI